MIDPGTLIAGRYEIVAPLGSGGSGLVYSATDRTTEKRVAVKVLGPHVLHERAAREKLRLEAIVAGRVESEHIVQVWDAGVDAHTGMPFLVMELLKGHNLQELVEQQGPLDAATAVECLRQIASGLDKAHAWKDSDLRPAPIVHRDLKPENLFLTHREDGSPLVKILDFGLAKVLSGSATLSTEVRGTPLYMAPEQLSQAPVTPMTDIWSLGLIAFFLLTGKCYWKSGQTNDAVLPAVLKEVSDGPSVVPQRRLQEIGSAVQLGADFDDWFLHCVHLEPTRRFASAGEAVRALARALGRPEPSSPSQVTLRELHDVPTSVGATATAGDAAVPAAGVDHRLRRALPWLLGLLIVAGLWALIGKSRGQPTEAVSIDSTTPAASAPPSASPALVETPTPPTSAAPVAAQATVAAAPVEAPTPSAPAATTPVGAHARAAGAPPSAPEANPIHELNRSTQRMPRTAANTAPSGLASAAPNIGTSLSHRDPADHR